jgi:hypothetical protein
VLIDITKDAQFAAFTIKNVQGLETNLFSNLSERTVSNSAKEADVRLVRGVIFLGRDRSLAPTTSGG